MLNNLQVKNDLGRVINFDLRSPNTEDKKYPLVVFLHGFKGFKDWGFIPYFCEKLADNVIVVNMDFSFNGIIDAENSIYDSEIFRKNTISQQIKDANITIDYIKTILEGTNYFNGEVYLVGHSLGGATSVFLSTLRNDINKIVLLASISKINRNSERQKEAWKELGYMEFRVQPNNQTLHLDYSYQDDKDLNFRPNQLIEDLIDFKKPVLIIHGMQDVTVKIDEAKILFDARCDNGLEELTEFEFLPKCGHTFNVRNNKDNFEHNICLNKVIKTTNDFLLNNEL